MAVALAAGLQATGALTLRAERQPLQWLAQLCAENELTCLRLQRQLPGSANRARIASEPGGMLTVRLDVQPTPNPSFRRVEAAVDNPDPAAGGRPLQLSAIMGATDGRARLTTA